MNTSTTKLPKTPSALIRLALADLRACEADDRYEVDMDEWHGPATDDRGKEVCKVSLAGAVMAQTLGLPREQFIYCADLDLARYGRRVQDGLHALDCFQSGLLKEGLRRLKQDIAEIPTHEEYEKYGWVTGYDPTDPAEWEQFAWGSEYEESDPDKFHSQMNELADYFESQGL